MSVALAGFGTTSAVALPGTAPTVPVGTQLFAPSCMTDGMTSGQLLALSDVNGTVTKIGAVNPVASTDRCPNGSAYNPADGKFYLLENNVDGTITTLYSVDTATGIYTPIGTAPATLYHLIIDNEGNAFTTRDSVLYSLDLTDVSTSVVGGSDISDYCIAVNPVTDLITLISYNSALVSTISKSTGVITPTIVSLDVPTDSHCYALAFDSNGVAWMVDGDSPFLLYAGNITTGETWSIGNVVQGTTNLPVTALMIGVPPHQDAPVLANTGASSLSTIVLTGLAGFLTLAGILTLVVVRRRGL